MHCRIAARKPSKKGSGFKCLGFLLNRVERGRYVAATSCLCRKEAGWKPGLRRSGIHITFDKKRAARAAIDQAAIALTISVMPTLEKQLATAAMALPPKKRAKLAGLILDSIETKRDKAVAAKWAVEAESRAKAYKKGLLKAVPVARAFGFSV